MKKKVLAGTLRTLTLVLLCSILLVGVQLISASPAHAASRVSTVEHAPDGSCSNPYIIIWYNGGRNAFCVTRTGYNGLDFNLYNVTKFGVVGCVENGWGRVYQPAGVGHWIYYNFAQNIYSGPQPPYQAMTQIDITSTYC